LETFVFFTAPGWDTTGQENFDDPSGTWVFSLFSLLLVVTWGIGVALLGVVAWVLSLLRRRN
jgi:hypothetical protein